MFKYYPFLLLTLCATIQAMDMDDLEDLFNDNRKQTLAEIMDKQSTCYPCTRSTAAVGCCLTAPLAALCLFTTGGLSSLVTHSVMAGVAGSFGYELHKIRSEWNKDDEDGTNFTAMTTIFPLLMQENQKDSSSDSDSTSGSDSDTNSDSEEICNLRKQLRAQLFSNGYDKKND